MSTSKDDAITQFTGEYGFLSLEHPCIIEYEGIKYDNAATLFYAMRSTNPKIMRKIARLSPNKARQKASGLPDNPDYDCNKMFYLEQVNRLKFNSSPTLSAWLLETDPKKLVNTITHRDTWIGVRIDGTGENALGEALMTIRGELKRKASAKEYRKKMMNK